MRSTEMSHIFFLSRAVLGAPRRDRTQGLHVENCPSYAKSSLGLAESCSSREDV